MDVYPIRAIMSYASPQMIVKSQVHAQMVLVQQRQISLIILSVVIPQLETSVYLVFAADAWHLLHNLDTI